MHSIPEGVPTRFVRCLLIGILMGLGLLGCTRGPANEPDAQPAAESASRPDAEASATESPSIRAPKNCLLILLDAFDAGHVSHLGYPRETTPTIDALAAQGISFSNAYSQSPVTLGSTTSFMSGQYLPIPHRNHLKYSLNGSKTTLAEAFHETGFATAAFSENPYIRRRGGFDRGFDRFETQAPLAEKRGDEDYRRRDEGSTVEILDNAAHWIESNNQARWLCYLHLLRPHDPYSSPAPYGGMFRPGKEMPKGDFRAFEIRITKLTMLNEYVPTEDEIQYLIDVYDGGIAYMDALLDQFLGRLRAAGALDDTLIVIFSDHGEAFYQHGLFKHSKTVFNEMVHVPLVLIPPPGSNWTPGIRSELVELVDLYPTLVELFQLSSAQTLHGQSLVPALKGADPPSDQTIYSQTPTADQITFREGSKKLLYFAPEDTHSLIAWFDLDADPGEHSNLVTERSPPKALLDRARGMIKTYFVPPPNATEDLEADQEEMLRALGYLE